MQHKSEKQYLIQCFLVVLFAYLPVSSFLFSVKNDFFTAYYPLKHFFSSSLKSGVFPLWNPFLNYGFPIYGDISEAWWNPGTWIIGAFPGYNVWTFTMELIAYLLIAVWGCFKLFSRWIGNIRVRQIAAISYACSGFFVGHLQHFNWISAAAVLPVCIHAILLYQDSGKLKYLAASAFSLTWFVSTAHPGLIIGAMLFLIPLILVESTSKSLAFKRSLYIFLVTILCSAGILYGYAEVIPYTNRSGSVEALITREGSTTISSWISFLFSLPVMKGNFFTNDIALRNCFMGLIILAALLLAFSRSSETKSKLFLWTGIVFLLLSSDIILPLYRKIPLLNFIRLNGELRLFCILSFITGATIILDRSIVERRLINIVSAIRIMLTAIFAGSLLLLITGNNTLPVPRGNGMTEKIKYLLDNLQFIHLVILSSLIQILVCSFLIQALKQGNEKRLFLTVAAELIMATLLSIPFTGVGQKTLYEIDRMFSLSPGGISKPLIKPEKDVVAGYPKTKSYTGDWALSGKQIAQDSIVSYPLIFRETMDFIESANRPELMSLAPFFLKSGDSRPGVFPSSYSYTKLSFSISVDGPDTLILKQNFYPGWKAERNGNDIALGKNDYGFISIPLLKGKNELAISFDNKPVRVLLIYQFIMLSLMFAIYLFYERPSA